MKFISAIIISLCFLLSAVSGTFGSYMNGRQPAAGFSEGSFVYKFKSKHAAGNKDTHRHLHAHGSEPPHEHEHDQSHSHKTGVAQGEFSSIRSPAGLSLPGASKQQFASYAASIKGNAVTPTLFRPPIA